MDYKESHLLNKIFNRELTAEDIRFHKDLIQNLLKIEPAYGVVFDDRNFEVIGLDRDDKVRSSVNYYADRYNIPYDVGDQYFGKDILTNPGTEVKRLMRCIKKYK